MRRKVLFVVILLFSAIVLFSCKPDEIEIELYSSDIIDAMVSGVREVPVVITYELMGSDNSEEIQQATVIAKKYLKETTEYITTPGTYGDNFIIKSNLPIGTSEKLEEYFSVNKTPMAIYIDSGLAVFRTTPYFELLNKELKEMNYMLDFELPAKKTLVKIIGDSTQKIAITSIATFIDKKPELLSTKEIERRKTVEIEYYGSDGSVYSEISPQFTVEIR